MHRKFTESELMSIARSFVRSHSSPDQPSVVDFQWIGLLDKFIRDAFEYARDRDDGEVKSRDENPDSYR